MVWEYHMATVIQKRMFSRLFIPKPHTTANTVFEMQYVALCLPTETVLTYDMRGRHEHFGK